jgi:putative phosphoribosyl transferase
MDVVSSRPFRTRQHAGQLLADRLQRYVKRSDVVVLALPRGGVPVGFEVATRLHVPLDVFVVRKLGVPGHEELAMGAIASNGARVINDEVVHMLNVPNEIIERVAVAEQREMTRRERLYRGERSFPELRDRVVILVDDGLATGSTMRAAAQALRQHKPARIVVAVPTAAPETQRALMTEVDEVVSVIVPESFYAVGQWYQEFPQTSDEEVRDLLARSEM